MPVKHKRQWYACYELGSDEPRYLVSAISIAHVDKWLKGKVLICRVIPARVWHLVKVFSGLPYCLPEVNVSAPNEFDIVNEVHIVRVVILD